MEKPELTKELENAIVLSLLTYFYNQKLLTEAEFVKIKSSLLTGDINVDNTSRLCDVYM